MAVVRASPKLNHIKENHQDYTTLNHLKIDREKEFEVKIKEYNMRDV